MAAANIAQLAQRIQPYAVEAGQILAGSVVISAGGIAGGYVNKLLKKQSWYAEYIEANFKEWSPLVMSLLTAVGYAIAARYTGPLPDYVARLVVGIIAGFGSRTGGVLAGDTEVYVSGKAKILCKNVGTVQRVIVDGNDVTQNATINGEEVDLSNTGIAKGVHKVVCLGTDKAAYEELYIPM